MLTEEEQDKTQPGDLRIWYIHQVPGPMFTQPVESPEEGKRILDAIYQWALFAFENRVIPEYANVGGVEEYVEWHEDGEIYREWQDYDFESPGL